MASTSSFSPKSFSLRRLFQTKILRRDDKIRKLRRPAESSETQMPVPTPAPSEVMERSVSAPLLPTIKEDEERSGVEADIEDNEGVSEDPASDSEVGF